MNWFKKTFAFLFYLIVFLSAAAQRQPVYLFQKDDSLLKKKYYQQALQNQTTLLSSLTGDYKKDYKEIYENRFELVSKLFQSSRPVTDRQAHDYLQSILKIIVDSNPELRTKEIRLVFSRDWWPNAYSMGEGTLVVNAGLLIFLNNEAELVFVLGHELAHYYRAHSETAIKKQVELVNSAAFKNELERIKKQEFRVQKTLDSLLKPILLSSRKHSRDKEAEADKYAFSFLKNTGYDANAVKTCLQLLDKVDDSLLYKPVNLQQHFNFNEYPFKKKWIQKESVLFGEMTGDDSPLTKKERDSLKTHPDCEKRILMLQDSFQQVPATGQKFLVDEKIFQQLKKDFIVEISEQQYRDKNLSRNLYFSLQMLQREEFNPVALFSIARCLNDMYDNQKNHRLGSTIDPETRGYPEDYNLLLRMISRIKLDELASLSYYFCKQYKEQMRNYIGFEEEYNKAKQRIN